MTAVLARQLRRAKHLHVWVGLWRSHGIVAEIRETLHEYRTAWKGTPQ